MSFITRKNIFNIFNPLIQAKRCRSKINVQKPKPPHFDRAKYLAIAKPFFEKKKDHVCDKNINYWKQFEIENPYQRLLAKELLNSLKSSRLVAFYHMNSMTGEEHYKAHVLFYRQNMLYKNYGKKTLGMAVADTPYEILAKWYTSHNMIVFSQELKIKELLKISKKFPSLVLLAAILDGKFVNVNQLQELSLIPNLQAAQAQLVQTLTSIPEQMVTHLTTHQNILVSQLQERMKQLEQS